MPKGKMIMQGINCMTAIEVFLSTPGIFPLFILAFVLLTFLIFHFTRKIVRRIFSIVAMLVWGFGMLYITWLSRTPIMETRINLLPFQPDPSRTPFDVITNIAMFVPYPILLYGILQRKLNFGELAGAGIGLPLSIEILQLFTHRGVCDMEDLILNSIGSVIGACIAFLLMKVEKRD